MKFMRHLAALAALSIATAPVAAAQPVRASAPTKEASELLGNNTVAIGVIGVFALLLVIVLATGDGSDDSPASP